MQLYLGSLYVNDFNRVGKTYQVIVQADAPYRADADSITQLKTRNSKGEMVPLGALMKIEPSFGPVSVTRHNGFYSADINGAPKPGFSSGQAQAEIEHGLQASLPRGITYDWTELVYQEKIAGNTMVYIFPLCVLLVFLVLAANYESWTLPLAIVLIVPLCIFSAILGVWLSGFFGIPADNNIFTQIAFVVLVGLACKNAIPIADPHDVGRVLRRRGPADPGFGCRLRDAARDGDRGVLRDGGRDLVRHFHDAGVLHAAANPGAFVQAGRRRAQAGLG